MDELREDIERMIADELRSHHQTTGPWVRAMVETDGDFDRARKRYRELRLAQLCAAREGDGPRSVRTELCHELERHNKASIYSVMGLKPDADEGEVASAISRIIVSGSTLDAAARYAVEVLGDEARRTEYDRDLLQQLRGATPIHAPALRVEQRAAPRSAEPSRRSMRDVWLGLGAVLVGLTYFGTEHYRELRRQEIETEVAARQAAIAASQRATREPRGGAHGATPVSALSTVQRPN
jgi:hypothetical protein